MLIPYLQIACELSSFQSYLVAFAFYISYFVMAAPSAWLLKITGFKKGMSAGLLLVAAGSLLFVPAALYRQYIIFLTGLFIQGAGLAMLQTASNPYVTILGPVESAAKRMSIMGICNGVAGIIAPLILGSVILSDMDGFTAQLQQNERAGKTGRAGRAGAESDCALPRYHRITAGAGGTDIPLPLPEITPEDEAVTDSGEAGGKTIFSFPYLFLGVFTLFLYVGVEVIAGNTIISYGTYQGIPMSAARFFYFFYPDGHAGRVSRRHSAHTAVHQPAGRIKIFSAGWHCVRAGCHFYRRPHFSIVHRVAGARQFADVPGYMAAFHPGAGTVHYYRCLPAGNGH